MSCWLMRFESSAGRQDVLLRSFFALPPHRRFSYAALTSMSLSFERPAFAAVALIAFKFTPASADPILGFSGFHVTDCVPGFACVSRSEMMPRRVEQNHPLTSWASIRSMKVLENNGCVLTQAIMADFRISACAIRSEIWSSMSCSIIFLWIRS